MRIQCVTPLSARTNALHTLRDPVITPILAAVRSPRMGRTPAHWTRSSAPGNETASICKPFSHLAIETR